MPLAPGTRLGPYEIVAPIGAGGMGEVYRATDTRLGRTVAIKTLNGEHMERFEREARAIAALNHPHICALHDVGALPNGTGYLVMEFIDGAPLLSPSKPGPLGVSEALRFAVQIAQALEAAHAKGITHRDLKPANILVTSTGAKLLDFGLAQVAPASTADNLTRSLGITQAGTVIGTAAYMSPEQAEGKPVDARSDIFSFGLVLYEMLAGRRPFAADSALATMAAILHKDPAPIGTTPALEAIVARCLKKSPADRFQSMREVRAALEIAALDASSGSTLNRSAAVTAPMPAVQQTPSIAVLPFANMSRDADDEYFSDGLAEEIIGALTQVPGLKVIARTSAFVFKGKNEDIRKIAETLGVTSILEGSVRRAGTKLRVTAQLVNATDGSPLWSHRYDREMTDIFAIQDEISAAIVNELKVNLTGHSLVKRAVTDVAAYEAVLEARHHLMRFTPATLERARKCLERAVSVDPDYPMAHVWWAEYHLGLATIGTSDPRQVMIEAEAAARRALELDESLAEAHAILGQIRAALEYDWTASDAHYRRSLALNPSSAAVHFSYAYWCLRPTGRLPEALAEIDRALELDPLSPYFRFGRAYVLLFTGQDKEAAIAAERTFDLDPDYFLSLFVLGYIRSRQGRSEEAIAMSERAIQVHGRFPMTVMVLGLAYAAAGRFDDARQILAELKQMAAKVYSSAGAVAIMYTALGELDEAFEWADRAVDQRDPQILSVKTSPVYQPLRSDARYRTLLGKMNLATPSSGRFPASSPPEA